MRRSSALEAARLLGPETRGAAWEDPFPLEEVLLLAVPDDALAGTASRLAGRARVPHPRVALHVSGALGPDVLAPLASRGVATAGMHPIRALHGDEDPAALRDTWFGLDGDPRALLVARGMVRDLGGRALEVPEAARPLYHAACCFASNAVVAAMAAAAALAEAAGLHGGEASAALAALLAETAAALRDRSPEDAATGPVVRGDEQTVALHLAAIAEGPIRRFYVAFSRVLLDLGVSRGDLPPSSAERIRRLLEGEETD